MEPLTVPLMPLGSNKNVPLSEPVFHDIVLVERGHEI